MLKLEPIGKKGAKKQSNLRTCAIVEDNEQNPVGVLRVSEDQISGGEELVELPRELKFALSPETREDYIDAIFICGGQGSGKSTWVGNYCRHFINAFHPDPEYITIISADDIDDKAYQFPHRHIKIDDEFVDNPLTLDDFTNPNKKSRSLVIFDDVEGLSSAKKTKALENLSEAILTMGRKRRIHCCFISHRAASGRLTKNILNELTACVWFPKLGGGRNLAYMLKNHLGIPDGLKECLKNGDWGRWVCLVVKVPQLILSEHRGAIYDHDEVEKSLKKRTIIDKKRATLEAENELGLR